MKNLEKSKVGDIVEIYGNAYKVKRSNPLEGCKKCALLHNDCDDIPCVSDMRDDNIDVYFEEVKQPKDEVNSLKEYITQLEAKISKLQKKYNEGSFEEDVDQRTPLEKHAVEVFDHVWKEIDENFDWSACEVMMDSVDWHWHGNGEYITIDNIRDHVKQMVIQIIEYNIIKMQPTSSLSSGGYEVSYLSPQDAAIRDGYDPKEGIWPSITIKFVGKEWSTDPTINK